MRAQTVAQTDQGSVQSGLTELTNSDNDRWKGLGSISGSMIFSKILIADEGLACLRLLVSK